MISESVVVSVWFWYLHLSNETSGGFETVVGGDARIGCGVVTSTKQLLTMAAKLISSPYEVERSKSVNIKSVLSIGKSGDRLTCITIKVIKLFHSKN